MSDWIASATKPGAKQADENQGQVSFLLGQERAKKVWSSPPREFTQHMVTTFLLWLLAGTVMVHYLTTWIVVASWAPGEPRQGLLDRMYGFFETAFTAEIGLVGAATAFYFSQRSQAGK